MCGDRPETVVIPALVAGIHRAADAPAFADSWIPGTSPGMTTVSNVGVISAANA